MNEFDYEDFKELKSKFDKLALKKEEKEYALKSTIDDIAYLKKRFINCGKAQKFLQSVAKKTQEKLEDCVSGIVSIAEAAVFKDYYEFKIKFVERRNKTECDLFFIKNNEEMDWESVGGGVLDIASFALRCAHWSLKNTRPTLVLDEPFRFVSSDLHEKCSEMLKTISEKLGVQIIMISHLPGIISSADKIFEVTQVGGISKAEEL